MPFSMRTSLVGVLVIGSSVLGAGPAPKAPREGKAPKVAAAPAPRKGLEAPAYLSPLARQLLKQRMHRHGGDMLALVQSVLFLDHATTQRLAGEIAAEPRLTRPIAGGADDVNAALPERFFVLQDELRSRALDLSAASQKPGSPELALRLGELTQTCVSCHTTYLEPQAPPAP